MTGVRIPIHEPEVARVVDTAAEGSLRSPPLVMVPLTLKQVRVLIMYAVANEDRNPQKAELVARMMTAHELLAPLDDLMLKLLGLCPTCRCSLPCDVCGGGA